MGMTIMCLLHQMKESSEKYFDYEYVRVMKNLKKKHIETTSSCSTYIGKNIQNDILNCVGKNIKTHVVDSVKKAGVYLMFDETTDISCTEQLTLVLRYVMNNEIHEDFVTFLGAY